MAAGRRDGARRAVMMVRLRPREIVRHSQSVLAACAGGSRCFSTASESAAAPPASCRGTAPGTACQVHLRGRSVDHAHPPARRRPQHAPAAVRPPLRPADLGLAVERRRPALQEATVAAEATGMRADVGRGRLEGLYPDRAMILREISALSQRTEPPGHLHAGLVPAARWAACGGWKRRAARPRGTARFGGGSAASGRPVHP